MSVEHLGQEASCVAGATMREPPTTPTTAAAAHKRRKLQLLANNSYLVVAAAAAANSSEHDTTKLQPASKRQQNSEQTERTERAATETTAIEPRDIVESPSCKARHNVHQQDDAATSRLTGASTVSAQEPEATRTTPELVEAPVRVPSALSKWYLDRRLSVRFLSVPKGGGGGGGGGQRAGHKQSRAVLKRLKTTITATSTSATVRPGRKQRQWQRQRQSRERASGDAETVEQEECKLGAPVKLEEPSQCRAKAQAGVAKQIAAAAAAASQPPPSPSVVSSRGEVEELRQESSESNAKTSDQSRREDSRSCISQQQLNNLANLKYHQYHCNTSGCLPKWEWAAPSSSSSSSSWLRLTTSGPLYALLLVSILMHACDSQFIGTNINNNNNNNNADLEAPVGANEVAYVDLRVKENSIQHHTILYEQIDHVNPLNPTGPSMVLRRGELFNIIIHLRHTYNKQTDKIRLEFSFGQRPQVGKGTLIYLPITKDRDTFGRDPSKWDARVVRVDGNQLSVQINLPANIAVGVWRFRVSTKLAGSRTIRTYTCKEALYMIFNAWSKDDAVYLSREDARQEYVLNDVGKIYIGSHAKPRGRKWIYGQFQESVLPAVMFMLDKTRLDIVGRSSVVKVARAVSAMVNSHDDNGLLVGNWSGNYGDGLAPWQWTGSATILEKYLQSGGEPVKFGQCWVFAGVTTTALRTLGIPARTVSNFVSAHDTDDSLTVDKFFSEKGDPISDVNSDSIWNFHVWSDAWMARNDLPPGYGGWQAVDATPQETSMGMYQMGPASLEAIKKGEVGFAYDAAFVFAEVNADIVHWQQDDKSELQWKKIKTLKFHIGRKIFTKMIGQLDDYTANGVADAEDIISQYKNKEGTEDERMSVLNAARCGGLGFLFEQPAPGKEDVEFELFDIDKVALGEPFLITVRIANKSPMRRTISLALSASSVYYTGILAQKVKRDRQNIVLNGLQEQQVRIRVNPDDYMERLVDYSMMKVYAIATVKETQQTWSKEDDFMIEKALLAGGGGGRRR